MTEIKTIRQTEKELILKALEHFGQNRTTAAHALGISVRTMRNKLKEYRSADVVLPNGEGGRGS